MPGGWKSSLVRKVRKALPWVVGAGVLAYIAMRVPFEAFRDAMGYGPHWLLATINLLIVLSVLVTDSTATWIGLHAVKLRRPFSQIAAVRGAIYMLFLVNFAVGQGGFGYYLHRSGTTPLRALGATLFLMGTTLATLLLIATTTWTAVGVDPELATLRLICLVAAGALALYLLCIAWAPSALKRREVFSPLFDAGVRGHLISIAARVPHASIVVLGNWVALRAWGIDVPVEVGLTAMPALAIIAVLPISPGGIGTTQAAFVFFFARFAPAETPEARDALVFAFAIVHFVYGVLASLIVGLACTPFARRALAKAAPAPSPP